MRLLVLLTAMFLGTATWADCIVIHSDKCKEFQSLFGYPEVSCDSESCDDYYGESVCTRISTEYDFFNNDTDYYYHSSTEPGSTSVSFAQGDACVQKRSCNSCAGTFPDLPKCSSNQDWNTFLWGSNVTYTGNMCNFP